MPLVCFSLFSTLWARFISIRVKESKCTCTSDKIKRRSLSFLLGAGLLELTSVVVERSSRCLLNRVSLKIRRGEVLGVIGLNGSGKSVLLQLMSGLIKPDRGRVQFRGEEQTRNPSLLRKSVVMCSGQSQAVGKLTVAAWVEYLVYIHGLDLSLIRSRLTEFQEWFPSSEQLFEELSWGDQRRAELAFAMCRRAPFYCLDQPSNGLDGLSQRQLGAQIKQRAVEGTTFALADHSAELMTSLCDRILIMRDGGIDEFLSRGEDGFREKVLAAQGWVDP